METNSSGYVNVSGGLITSHFISSMQGETVGFDLAKPETFKRLGDDESALLSQGDYEFNVQGAFENLKRRWDKYGPNLAFQEREEVLKYWIKPFFDEFGFNITKTTKQWDISEKTKFSFSHRGWNPAVHMNPPVVHVIPYGQSFDLKTERCQPCPHDAVQAYLNMNEDKWAILFNGRFLRLIRDFHHTTVKGYVEFDIEAIFDNRLYSDFQILYRFLHVSRFTPAISLKKKKDEEESADIYLEEYFKHSQAAGETVGTDLRDNVVEAIITLGNGFLTSELREELRCSEEKCVSYYEEILRTIYRIMFLLYAEQRGFIGGHDTPGRDIYLENYSITTLRNLAIDKEHDRYYLNDDHIDIWKGLLVTFQMIREGTEELDIYPYNGMLFDVNKGDYLVRYSCKNSSFLQAIRCLTIIRKEKSNISQIISYADLSVEEFGSVYESLLDYAPRITSFEEEIAGKKFPANSFILDPRGSDRKSTGSYYTNPQLVQQLIKSALEPVIEDRLSKVTSNDPQVKRKALLSIKVCDSASGSGAFLIAACNRLGKELAKIMSDEEIPPQDVEQNARREVLLHCIYGIDVNPMAVELAKVSLWINAAVRDKPLNFLDHHIKCGNSLIGATPELMAKGIPSDAFTPVEGDDKTVASQFKKINTEQHKVRTLDSWKEVYKDKARICSAKFAALGDVDESDPNAVHLKKKKYSELLANEIFYREKFLADLWTSAFFWKLDDKNAKVPTHSVFLSALKDINLVDPDICRTVEELAREHRFFHWHVEFPDIFGKDDPGFDCVLGNPPWEKNQVEDKQFFGAIRPDIAKASGAQRKNKIQALIHEDSNLYEKWISHCRSINTENKFIRQSKRFILSGTGKFNTYSLFVEHYRNIINTTAYVGMIIQSGLATDDNTKAIFSDIIEKNELVSLYDFVNSSGLFPGVHRMFKFSLLTLSNPVTKQRPVDLVFFLDQIDQLHEVDRHFTLTLEDFKLINPNTKSCPTFRNKQDAEIVKKIYRRVPIFVDESKSNNPWSVMIRRMFNETDDSDLLKTKNQLDVSGYTLSLLGRFERNEDVYVRFYEAKMINQFDHRFGTFKDVNDEEIVKGNCRSLTIEERNDPKTIAIPRYWVLEKDFEQKIEDRSFSHWFVTFRNITNAANERTVIFTIIPKEAAGTLAPQVFLEHDCKLSGLLVANFNSLVLDFVARQKVGGTHLNHYILRQFPIIPPDAYGDNKCIENALANVIELIYVSLDLETFAQDILAEIGPEKWNEWFPDNPLRDNRPQPFKWDTDRRFELQHELDAIYAHLYGISREDLEYILETFPIVRKNDEKNFGKFKTKELVLKYYDKYEGKLFPVKYEVA